MSSYRTPNREEQALAEVGRTLVGRSVATVLVLLFLLPVAGVPILQGVLDWRRSDATVGGLSRLSPALSRLAEASRAAAQSSGGGVAGLWELNRGVLTALDDAEQVLESTSLLRRRLLPRLQLWQTRFLGLGNEQAYVGRGGWLFYRPDVDYLAGPGFLEPRVLERRTRGGDLAAPPPVPDPRPAILAFASDLRRRGIRLLVVPTPVKPEIHPDAFSPRLQKVGAPLRNPSFLEFVGGLAGRGVEVVDPAPLLAELAGAGEPQYLLTDTHWTPQAVEKVARALAQEIGWTPAQAASAHGYLRRLVVVDGRGDIAGMLRFPPGVELFRSQPVRVERVFEADGRPWQEPTVADVLLLGDSFSNVFSDPGLGWGAGAGLAEQLSFALDRPVARLALNAGGAAAARLALRREVETGVDRLAAATVVVYQFATRELGIGSWPVLTMKGDAAPAAGPESEKAQVVGSP